MEEPKKPRKSAMNGAVPISQMMGAISIEIPLLVVRSGLGIVEGQFRPLRKRW